MKMPLLKQENQNIDTKELTRAQVDAQVMMQQLQVDHETFRKDQWEQLKNFRSKYDTEYHQSESVLDQQALTNKKKEIDKLLLNAVRLSIMNNEHENVISYMEMMNFS
jgi:hypothetical protein